MSAMVAIVPTPTALVDERLRQRISADGAVRRRTFDVIELHQAEVNSRHISHVRWVKRPSDHMVTSAIHPQYSGRKDLVITRKDPLCTLQQRNSARRQARVLRRPRSMYLGQPLRQSDAGWLIPRKLGQVLSSYLNPDRQSCSSLRKYVDTCIVFHRGAVGMPINPTTRLKELAASYSDSAPTKLSHLIWKSPPSY